MSVFAHRQRAYASFFRSMNSSRNKGACLEEVREVMLVNVSVSGEKLAGWGPFAGVWGVNL